jgi:hypothetical protein
MSNLEEEDDVTISDADFLAEALNKSINLTIDALLFPDTHSPAEVLGALRPFREAFSHESLVGHFLDALIAWLEGQAPTRKTLEGLQEPFRGRLSAMMDEVRKARQESGEEKPPISGNVLAQLMTTVIAATRSEDRAVQAELAAKLINIHGQLPKKWKPRIGPLLDNLRAVLGGAQPHTLPKIPDPHYQNLWQNAADIIANADLSEEHAEEQLLERLIHNTRFTLTSNDADLTEGFLRALLDVQRQALSTGAPHIAMLVTAIRTLLQGGNTAMFAEHLTGAAKAAWEKIIAE